MLWTSLVFGLVAVFSGPGSCCDTQEYRTQAAECCPMCHEGTFVQSDCTPLSGTRCRPCDNGTYMDQPNGLKKCFSCSSCVADNGLFVWQKCTNKTDTVCDVLNGFFCKSLAEVTGCSMAEKHTRCAAGQRIKEPGTDRTDTVCEDCLMGFFSHDGVKCTPWTICSETQVQVKDGDPRADVICSSASTNTFEKFFCLALLHLFLHVTTINPFCFN
ncbi:tumor necrosis factor receptor superfamily member 14-like isoform X2 [Hippoglossus stenolepis]|uniref:tumor necrosis factor receptor superfamily member 14-like isoform X2 n=1 Tax=Hippoglossus stenolepis TaxID=195615 RepID=UPI00159C1F9B|nr:tumor necrosis factor receptor superfamily member 14-like isoform X2 [Hippoglossus stenolepis]